MRPVDLFLSPLTPDSLIEQAIPLILPLKSVNFSYPHVCMGSFDAKTRQWEIPLVEPDDFGDYLIFILRYAQLFSQAELVQWVQEEFRFAYHTLRSPQGLYRSWNQNQALPRPSFFKTHRVYEHMDLLLGWHLLFLLTQEESARQGAEDLAQSLIRFTRNPSRGYFYDSVWAPLRMPLHKLIKPEINGILAEELINLSELTHNSSYLKVAQSALLFFYEQDLFQKRGLFPDGYLPYLLRPWKVEARFMKTQTNLIFACLRYYEVTREERFAGYATHACESIARYQREDGAFPHKVNIQTGKVSHPEVLLTQNFALIDLFIQASFTLKNQKFLEIAQCCARFWLSHQAESGLIPEEPLRKKNNKMDQNADFSVSLLKLAEMTDNPSLRQKAEKILQGLNRYHRADPESSQASFAKSVDVFSTEITNFYNETKYLGGFLKALLAFKEAHQGRSLLSDPLVKMIYRDR
jgi:uncharacterized protein YyaL (SSP411 family)